ncbi:MAG: hypothetical protein HY905_06340 [Deltaproteobacteria bacterium]|nr:hypothetical protein [Deltaproteobacteria bacterium]
MRKVFVAFAACLLVAAPAAADAPAYMPVQGFLTDAGGAPVDGDVAVRFGLYTADLGGTEVWNETQTVAIDQGFFTAYLGDVTVLNLTVFRDNDGLWLGVRVGSDAEMSRFQVASTGYAAYAQYAGDAEMLGGTPASGFVTTAGGVAWSSLSGVPAGFADGTDDGTTYSAGTGLTLTGSTFAADQATVQGWAQGVCYDTELELTTALDDNYAALAHTHPWSALTAVPAGFADGTDDVGPAYTAGAGLSLAGTTLSLNSTGCPSGGHLVWNGAAWTCVPGVTIGGGYLTSVYTLVAGNNYVYPASGASFTPTANGLCHVTATVDLRAGPNTNSNTYVRVAYRAGAVNNDDGWFGPYMPTNTTQTGTTVASVISVTAGTAYTFGCYVSANGDFVGDTMFCRVSFICQ